MSTDTWTFNGNANWAVKGNWSGGVIPVAGDTVLINQTLGGPYTITYNNAAATTLQAVVLSNANATLTFDAITSRTLAITTGGTGTLAVSAGTVLVGNTGSVATDIINASSLVLSGGSIGVNAQGELNIGTATGTLGNVSIGGNAPTISGGVLSATGAVGISNTTLTVNGTGSISAGSFTLTSGAFSESAGTVSVTGAAAFNGGTAAVSGGTFGVGSINDTNAQFNVSGGAVNAGTITITSGGFTESAGTITDTGVFSFNGGNDTITGGVLNTNSLVINNNVSLGGGTIASTGGALTINSANTLTVSGSGVLDGSASGGSVADAGVIVGTGTIKGPVTGTGSVIASGGVLDLNGNIAASSGLTLDINTTSNSLLELDGTIASGNTVTFLGSATGGPVLELTNVSVFSGTIANLGTSNSATSLSSNYINVQTAVARINAGSGTTNIFDGTSKTINLYSDAAGTSLIQTITLASAPTAGTFIDYNAPGSLTNGGALGGTDLFLSTAICYAAGTLITTEQGEVAIEALSEGDMIVTLQDGQHVPMPVKWMGVRHIDLTRHPAPHAAAPIRIRAGAFGDDLPRRDLLVSPAHAIYVDGKMVPANLLINHMTIVQDLDATAVTYHHVELERHAVILAEGLTSESYLDMGNRAFFSNAGLAMVLHPEFHVNAGLKQWEENACAPLAVDAETVAPIWNALAARAEALGYVPPRFTTTQDADLYLEANGRRLRPVSVAKGRHTFMLPAGATDVVLRSRAAAPADLDPLSGDWRPLGVAVRGMTLRKGDEHIAIPADHPALTQGWHTAEQDNGNVWRWTAGNAAIPMTATNSPVMLDIDIGMTGTYVLTRSDQEQRLAA